MTESKKFDILYPDAVAGVVTAANATNVKSLEQIVADANSAIETTQVVSRRDIKYDYLPVARD